MTRLMMLIVLALPLLARADDVWRWVGPDGQIHYSNVPGHIPAHAQEVRKSVGHLSLPPASAQVESEPEVGLTISQRRREERLIQRRLQEIEAFYNQVRARQLARLQANGGNATLLPDWMVADRWLQAKEEEERLRAALTSVRRPGS